MHVRSTLFSALLPPVLYYVAMFSLGPLFGVPTWEWSLWPWWLPITGLLLALLVGLGTATWAAERQGALVRLLEASLRYSLVYLLVNFGIAKLYPGQFISYNRDLDLPLGSVSAFRLAFRFFGYSVLYTGFTAGVEMLAAILLSWKRTAPIGLLAAAAALTNIVMLDIAYRIPPLPIAATMALTSLVLLADYGRQLRGLFAGPAGAIGRTKRWAGLAPVGALALMVAIQIRDGAGTSSGLHAQSPATGRWDVIGCTPAPTIALCQVQIDTLRPIAYLEIGRWGELVLGPDRQAVAFQYTPQTDSLVITSSPSQSQDQYYTLPLSAGMSLTLRGQVRDADTVTTMVGTVLGIQPFTVRLRRTQRLRYRWF